MASALLNSNVSRLRDRCRRVQISGLAHAPHDRCLSDTAPLFMIGLALYPVLVMLSSCHYLPIDGHLAGIATLEWQANSQSAKYWMPMKVQEWIGLLYHRSDGTGSLQPATPCRESLVKEDGR
jgi:hypothetical protein